MLGAPLGSVRDRDARELHDPALDRESAAEMGLSPVHAVHLTRAWLVVEGEHDKQVLRHFYGRELSRARIPLLALRGVNEALALLQLGHLSTIGKPLCVMFDSVRAEWVTGEPPPTSLPSREEKVIDQLRRQWNDPDVDLRVEPFSSPDIICALPEDAVRRALSETFRGQAGPFLGWDSVVTSYEEAGGKGQFKDFALRQQMKLGAPGSRPTSSSQRSSLGPIGRRCSAQTFIDPWSTFWPVSERRDTPGKTFGSTFAHLG